MTHGINEIPWPEIFDSTVETKIEHIQFGVVFKFFQIIFHNLGTWVYLKT